MKRQARAIRLLLMVAGIGMLVGSSSTAGATGGGGPVAQTVLGSGAQTSQFLMHALDKLYLFSPGCAQIPTPSGPTAWLDFSCQSTDPPGTVFTENYEHDQVHEATFVGSSVGIQQLCATGQSGVAAVDFVRSSRGPVPTDCAGLHFVAYARDGLSWQAFDGGTTSSGVHGLSNQTGACSGSSGATQLCLSQQNLRDIYINCTVTNWSQVGGQNVPISIYTPVPGSGARVNWDSFLGGDSSHCIASGQLASHVIQENSTTAIPTSDQAGAIFPFSSGLWTNQVNGRGNAVLGAVDNVAPTASALGDGSYPYGTYLYNVYCTSACPGGASSTATVNYVGEDGWICKPGGSHATNPQTGNNFRTDIARTISGSGFVPLPYGPSGSGSRSSYCRLATKAPLAAADFEGDRKTDLTIFRNSSGAWFTSYSSGIPFTQTSWGAPGGGDIPVPADYDGAGRVQVAVYRPSTGVWYVLHGGGGYATTTWGGQSGDVPVPADYDGTGKAQIAIFRPSTGEWFVLHADGSYSRTVWGASSDIPVPADYDGSAGRAQPTVFRPSTGEWFVLHADGSYSRNAWGASTDIPVPGDYDGSGRAQLTVFKPGSGAWYVHHADGSYSVTSWGQSGDVPVPGDYTGGGRAQMAVYRPGSTGTWFVLTSASPAFTYTTTAWGTTGDAAVVLPSAVRQVFFP